MVTDLDFLIWVEVHFVLETMKQSHQVWSLFGSSKLVSKSAKTNYFQELTESRFQFRVPHFGELYLPN